MTEDEAKTKWCPMAREILVASCDETRPAHNRVEVITSTLDRKIIESLCIGSRCMMWCWNKTAKPIPQGLSLATMAKLKAYPEMQNTDSGYCGLSGK